MLSAAAQTEAAHAVWHAAAAHMQSPAAWSAASIAVGVPARQQSSHAFASAFFPHADVSESGVDGAGVLGLADDPLLLLPLLLLLLGVFVLSPDVLAFFDDDVDGVGSGAPLHATAASATKDERQSAKRETWFMAAILASEGATWRDSACCRLRADPVRMCAHPRWTQIALFCRLFVGVIRIAGRRPRLDHERAITAAVTRAE
jgi:hypothetical protein